MFAFSHSPFKWTVRVDAGPFMGDPNDRIVWHFLSSAASLEQAVAQMRNCKDIPPWATITAFPRMM